MSEEKNTNKLAANKNLHKSKNLTIYSSITEAAEVEVLYVLNQKPLERIRETVELILRVFPLNKKKPNTNKIYIDKS